MPIKTLGSLKTGSTHIFIFCLILSSVLQVNRSQNYQKTLSFVTGPKGCVFVVEAFTDNVNRIRNSLSSLVKKTG